ncbi:MAG: hypothetical protein ACJ8GJ_21300 [Vitreoscilla sp.]
MSQSSPETPGPEEGRPRRALTLLVQEPARKEATGGWRLLQNLNEVIKSPLFVFLVGSSLVGFWPAVDGWLHPAKLVDERNRADIALVIPLISALKDGDSLKVDTTQAILLRLRDSGAQASDDHQSPIFDAAYQSLAQAAASARESPSAGTSDTALAQIAKAQEAAPTPSPAGAERGNPDGAAGQVAARPTPADVPPQATPTAAPSLGSLRQGALVYIQAARDSVVSRDKAAALLKALVDHQVLAPAVQNMACKTIPQHTQVRYFNEVDRSKADDLAAFVGQSVGLPTAVARPALQAKPGTLEVWIGQDAGPVAHC